MLISGFQLIAIAICNVINVINLEYVVKASILFVIFYEIYITVTNYNEIGNKNLKKAVKIFTIISMVFFSFFIFETFRAYLPLVENVIFLKMLSLPAYFLTLNVFSFFFATNYFNLPAFIEDDKLTPFFIDK